MTFLLLLLAAPGSGSPPVASGQEVARIEVAGDGAMLSCASTRRGSLSHVRDFCNVVRDGPLERRLQIRGGPGETPLKVITELTFNVEGSQAYPAEYSQPGRRLVSRISARFEISETGAVENCRIVDKAGSPDLHMPLCEFTLGARFTPGRNAAGEPVRATVDNLAAFSIDEGPAE